MSTHTQDRDEFSLSSLEVARSFDRAARSYDAAAVLQARVRDELLSRLDMVRLEPSLVVDLGCGTGAAERALRRRYRRSRVFSVDLSLAMLREADRRRRPWRRFAGVCADAIRLPLADTSTDLVFSNLMLQWCADPEAVFRECSACCDRAPDLHELRARYAQGAAERPGRPPMDTRTSIALSTCTTWAMRCCARVSPSP